ncbi:MAG: hypothetical protein CM15mP58_02180 [Burkholderiaceae bacterium]|nr:MAG: hypothetical protein CM15mP58_02180 [Burkholderiaceae bacterium]
MKGITRATKIVATLGPATDSPQKIEQFDSCWGRCSEIKFFSWHG